MRSSGGLEPEARRKCSTSCYIRQVNRLVVNSRPTKSNMHPALAGSIGANMRNQFFRTTPNTFIQHERSTFVFVQVWLCFVFALLVVFGDRLSRFVLEVWARASVGSGGRRCGGAGVPHVGSCRFRSFSASLLLQLSCRRAPRVTL